ncbi:hypothetical protein PVAP13_9NG037646 [Panicum virgatum]|uniref:Uncharacterized protein n=1 Tax=Panicum virgatum TaxID=38727 RepID=A0A8T0MBN5_PANVG|nr:hypothetical protein PVAP13_9NG037646 [Panicum virgatum]
MQTGLSCNRASRALRPHDPHPMVHAAHDQTQKITSIVIAAPSIVAAAPLPSNGRRHRNCKGRECTTSIVTAAPLSSTGRRHRNCCRASARPRSWLPRRRCQLDDGATKTAAALLTRPAHGAQPHVVIIPACYCGACCSWLSSHCSACQRALDFKSFSISHNTWQQPSSQLSHKKLIFQSVFILSVHAIFFHTT